VQVHRVFKAHQLEQQQRIFEGALVAVNTAYLHRVKPKHFSKEAKALLRKVTGEEPRARRQSMQEMKQVAIAINAAHGGEVRERDGK